MPRSKERKAKPPLPARPEGRQSQESGFPIVGLGASAGGLEAFQEFFKAMPAASGMAFVVVAHLDPTHVSLLPELLQKCTSMPVRQVTDGTPVEADHVYVIPPNKDLFILNGVLQLLEPRQPRGANLPIDNFFRALAKDRGANAVGVILSGTGTDGTLGLKAIKGELGLAIVQDEASAKYDGMPRSAIATNVADYVLPPSRMPERLIQYTRHAASKAAPRALPAQAETPDALQKIFLILRSRTNHDFSHYKTNTLCRRIERRMNVHQIDDIREYVRYLGESDREVEILFKDLLIGVTNFFRDPAAFEILKEQGLPKLMRKLTDDYNFRVWVPGCSSGEEAYSLAITIHECMAAAQRRFTVQIFGTDIDDDAIAIARSGLYPASILADVGSERIQRYFFKEESGHYRIKKSIREMLVFARQNLIKDPPFTKLDLLSCRNLLIYLSPEIQKNLLPVFHYSLRPHGLLFLGSSETVGHATDLFGPIDRKWKIFERRARPAAPHPVLSLPEPRPAPAAPVSELVRKAEDLSSKQLVETILHQSQAPPCAIIDDASNIVYIHGRTGRFLEPAEGKVSVNIVDMARPGLKAELANAIRDVSRQKQEVAHRGLRLRHGSEEIYLDLAVKPILDQTAVHGLMMVIFQETASPPKKATKTIAPPTPKRQRRSVADIEQELRDTREHLQTTIEELETSNEELKSTNEELQSTNEELQSTNEEIETSKEELQSLNEESATVNAELQSRIEELSRANDDLKNLLDSTDIATVFLDIDLRIRRFTPKATEIIPLVGSDSGRPIHHFAHQIIDADLRELAKEVLETLIVKTAEVHAKNDNCYLMRIRPYRTTSNVIDGVVMTFDDITQLKETEQSLRTSENRLTQLLQGVPARITVVDHDGTIQYMNKAWGSVPKDVIGAKIYEHEPPESRDAYREALAEVFRTGEPCRREVRGEGGSGESFVYDIRFSPITDTSRAATAVLIAAFRADEKE